MIRNGRPTESSISRCPDLDSLEPYLFVPRKKQLEQMLIFTWEECRRRMYDKSNLPRIVDHGRIHNFGPTREKHNGTEADCRHQVEQAH